MCVILTVCCIQIYVSDAVSFDTWPQTHPTFHNFQHRRRGTISSCAYVCTNRVSSYSIIYHMLIEATFQDNLGCQWKLLHIVWLQWESKQRVHSNCLDLWYSAHFWEHSDDEWLHVIWKCDGIKWFLFAIVNRGFCKGLTCCKKLWYQSQCPTSTSKKALGRVTYLYVLWHLIVICMMLLIIAFNLIMF